ncbi:hypothetical protein F183_A27610 [Bryobacterales bacterium F-183]|nr:hypothetical protein F183_A27610 [Bryobacterales bacterium F-183]
MSSQILAMDRELALDRVGGDEDLLREIAGLFLEDYPKLVENIKDALAAKDASGVERASHSLKGAVANFGAEPAYQAALALEKIGRSGSLQGAEEAYNALRGSLDQLEPELLALAGGGTTA